MPSVLKNQPTSSASGVWDEYLKDLYSKLSEYDIQKDKSLYNVTSIEDWGRGGSSGGLTIDKTNLPTFFDKVSSLKIANHDTVKVLSLTEEQLKKLNNVLDITVKKGISVKYDYNDGAIVTGDFVKLSDLTPEIRRKIIFPSGRRELTIFATNTVFIDDDWTSEGEEIQLNIAAPKIHIVDKRLINLRGRDADVWSELKNGESGSSGWPGGNFFAIAGKIINSQSLTVNVDGTDGRDGIKGEHEGYYAKIEGVPDLCRLDLCDAHSLTLPSSRGERDVFRCVRHELSHDVDFDEIEFRIYGEDIRTEKGGSGGKGGAAGEVSVFELEGSGEISTSRINGLDGTDGLRGPVGASNHFVSVFYKTGDGKTGSCARNMVPHTSEDNPDPLKPAKDPITKEYHIKVADIAGKYRDYLWEELKEHVMEDSLIEFLVKVDENEDLMEDLTAYRIRDDFEKLEKKFFTLSEEMDFVPFYKNLLKKIGRFSQKSQPGTEESELFNYLYAAVLSKLHILKNNANTNLIVDVGGYLSAVERDILDLKASKAEQNALSLLESKMSIIGTYRDQYETNLRNKINEATAFIEEFEKEINAMQHTIKIEILEIIEQINKRESDVEQMREQLVEKLQKQLILKSVLGCFRIIGALASFLGPIGMAVNLVIQVSASIIEPIASSAINNQKPDVKISDNVTYMKNEIVETTNKMTDNYVKTMKLTSSEIGSEPEIFSEVKKKLEKGIEPKEIKDIKDKVQKGIEDGVKSITEKVDEINKQLEDASISTDIKSGLEKKHQKLTKSLGRLGNFLALGSAVVDTYADVTEGQAAIDDVVAKADAELKALGELESNVRDTLGPALQRMHEDLQVISKNLEGKSHVFLDVTNWKIQQVLKDATKTINKIFAGRNFEGVERLKGSMEKTSALMSMLISMYDHIENYQEQKHLANYIANIASAEGKAITSGSQFDALRNKLDIMIRSNLILSQFQISTNAFKQFAFPFAEHFIGNYNFFKLMRDGRSISQVVDEAATKIQKLNRNLEFYETQATEFDRCLMVANKERDAGMKKYYTWRGEDHNSTFSKLLSGEIVTLRADIRGSSSQSHAIKFNEIRPVFIAREESMQAEMSKALADFKLEMTHLGDSYYRFDDKYYQIITPSVFIPYDLNNDAPQKPDHIGGQYDKVRRGDFLLSPFATWKLQLSKKYPDDSSQEIEDLSVFDFLKKYGNETDLALEGRGQFVDKSRLCRKCDAELKVDKYYEIASFNKLDGTPNREHHFTCTAESHRVKRNTEENQDDEDDDSEDLFFDTYATNSAPTSISSPFNELFAWMKNHGLAAISTTSALVRHLTSTKQLIEDDRDYLDARKISPMQDDTVDMYYDAFEIIEETLESDLLGADQPAPKRIKSTYYSEIHQATDNVHQDNSIGLISSDNFNGSKMHSTPGANADFSHIQNFQGSGLLMLADVLVRSFNGEKYQHSAFVSLEQQKAMGINDIKQRVHTAMQEKTIISGPYYQAA